MKKVSDILSRKGTLVVSVPPSTKVIDALRLMADKNIGSVVVMEGEQYLGIVTERDYSRKVVLNGKSSTDTEVGEIMSEHFPKVELRDSLEHCMQLFSDKNIRYLPVFDNGYLIGIVSINDAVRETIEAQEETISSLKDYLHANL